MNSSDVHLTPAPKDKGNTENFLPDKDPACNSPQGKFSAKGDCRRQALTSLQFNTDCGSETLKNSNSLEVPSEPKTFPAGTPNHCKPETPTTPGQRSEVQDISSGSEDHSVATARSTSDSTWKSCVDQISPSLPSAQSTAPSEPEQYDTAEDTSSCSFEDLPSSKEVSFNLPPGYSNWAQCTSSSGQPADPPAVNSVQTLCHIVTTVLENNPEIYPQTSAQSADPNPSETLPETVPSQDPPRPSVASQILQRSGVLQESQEAPGLSDSFSELINKLSSLSVEDADYHESLATCVNDPGEQDSGCVKPTEDTSLSSELVEESVPIRSDSSVTNCDSIPEAEGSPLADAPEDLVPESSSPSSLLPKSSNLEENQLPVASSSKDVQQLNEISSSELSCIAVENLLERENAVEAESSLAEPEVEVKASTVEFSSPAEASEVSPVEEQISGSPVRTEFLVKASVADCTGTVEEKASADELSSLEQVVGEEVPVHFDPFNSLPADGSLPIVNTEPLVPQAFEPVTQEQSLGQVAEVPYPSCDNKNSDPDHSDVVHSQEQIGTSANSCPLEASSEPSVSGDQNPALEEVSESSCAEVEDQPQILKDIQGSSDSGIADSLVVNPIVEEETAGALEEQEVEVASSANDISIDQGDNACAPHPPSDLLDTTDALFAEFNSNVSDNLTSAAPLKSLLDSTFTEVGEVPTNNQNCVASEASSNETRQICPDSSEPIVLEVPAKEVLTLVEVVPDPHKLLEEENTSENIAKEVAALEDEASKEPKDPNTQFCRESSVNIFEDLPDVDTVELERLIRDCDYKVEAMPMHMMEAQLEQQWHQNDQVNSMVGDNNCDVDVNVNQCHPLQGNNYHHHSDTNLMTASQVSSDILGELSTTSSPNKRKNDEDSAFEDLATVEDANSDLVDDHIMDDQVEEIGVAAVNRRSPLQTRIPESSPSKRADVTTTGGDAKVSDLPALNHSEAGPVVAEFTEEELKAAAEVFKDASTFEFLERVSNSKAFEESSLSRLSLYVKFDPLVSKKSQENQNRSTFKKPVAPQKKSVPVGQELLTGEEELISTANHSASPPIRRRDLDAHKLIDFHSPNPPQSVARANPKMVPVEPVQRIENMQPCKVFTEDDMKKAMKINELMFNERVIKKEKELAEAESKMKAQAEAAREQNRVLQDALTFTRRLLEDSGRMMRQWQEKKELERVEVTRERDQALEDLRSVEASFSELHRRYEKIKAVLEGYKQNEEGLRVQLLDTQDKLRQQEQLYEVLKEHTQEKLESANLEIENARKAGGSEIAVLRSQLMKAEMKVNSLEKSLEHKAQEYVQLTEIYDDLIARVSSGSQ